MPAPSAQIATTPVAAPADARARAVADARVALHEQWRALERPMRIAVDVPAVSMTGVFGAVEGAAALWLSPRGEQQVAFGERGRATASGPERFASLRDGAAAAFDAWPVHASADGLPFRLVSAATFDDATYDEVWSAFPAAFVATPLATVVRHRGRHALLVCADPDDSDAVHGFVDRVLDAIAVAPPIDAPRAPRHARHADHEQVTSQATYEGLVRSITAGIADGAYAKVVAARRLDLHFGETIDAAGVLQQLAFGYPDCVRFALRWEGADHQWRTFLGATPERLLRIDGRRLESEALAGTIAADDDASAETLLASTKDQEEHRLVVDHLRHVYGDATTSLDIDDAPGLRRLRNALHLRTEVTGTLRDGVDGFELLQRAHPTPAVGGLPVEPALRWIREQEPTPRGAYAAPIGWVADTGDAEFMVAIRSGVLRGRQASLFAGAGIVGASDPALEWAETDVKLEALLEALVGPA